MKISHRNVPYSAIPRLVKEGVIKVGTKVKACDDQEKYPNGLGVTLRNKMIGTISRISDNTIDISRDDEEGMIVFTESSPFFLDILSDEEEEIPCKICRNRIAWSGKKDDFCSVKHAELYAKPLSFDEPLTKEAVGRWIVDANGERRRILDIGMTGNAVLVSKEDDFTVPVENWTTRQRMKEYNIVFESSPEEITIEEAEKLTGKKIKR